ncbi:hypothetical protein PFISCL1PPCAC_7511, partial [Pristionchus fissidentatus]
SIRQCEIACRIERVRPLLRFSHASTPRSITGIYNNNLLVNFHDPEKGKTGRWRTQLEPPEHLKHMCPPTMDVENRAALLQAFWYIMEPHFREDESKASDWFAIMNTPWTASPQELAELSYTWWNPEKEDENDYEEEEEDEEEE